MYTRFFVAIVTCFLGTAALAQPILPGGGGGGEPPPAAPAGLQRVTAEDVAGIIRKVASNLEVEVTKFGELPGVVVKGWRGFGVGIAFYGCKPEGCVSMQIFTFGKAPSHVDLQYVNGWNTKWRFTKLYLDKDKNYHLEMDVVCEGGVTTANVIANLGTYDWFLVELSGGKH
jgi:hypothetical protein